MEQATAVDHFEAYRWLIGLHRNMLHRAEAEQLLAAFQAEAAHMPEEHWVHDDLKQVRENVFEAKRALDGAQRLVAEGNVAGAAFSLSMTLARNTAWFTVQERFAIYSSLIELCLRLQDSESARIRLAQLEGEVKLLPSADPIHDGIRVLEALVQQFESEENQSED